MEVFTFHGRRLILHKVSWPCSRQLCWSLQILVLLNSSEDNTVQQSCVLLSASSDWTE